MKFRCLKMLAGMGLYASVLLTSAQAEAILASVKSTAMAAAVIAHPIDALAGAYNPAGMTEVGDRIDLGVYWVQDDGHAHISGNTPTPPQPDSFSLNGGFNSMRTNNFYSADFGVNKTFCTEICGDTWEWALGLISYNRNFQKTTYQTTFPILGTSHLGLEYCHVTVAPTLAVKINECHSLGIAFNVQIERFKANGVQNFAELLSIDPENASNRGYNYSTGFTPTFGWLWHVTDAISFGATYQPKTSMPKLKKYRGFLAQRGRLDIPQKIGAGIAWDFMPCATVEFDVEHINWKQIKALSNSTLNSEGGLNPLGSSDGPGFGFRNQLYYRVGVEYQLDQCWTLRAGYRWVRVPFKKADTAVNLLTCDTVESFFTCGATWNYDACTEFSGLFAYGFEKSVSGVIPPQLNGGNITVKESKFAVALSAGYKF